MSRAFEIRVIACLLGRNAAGRVVLEAALEQGQAILVQVRAKCLRIVAVPLGESRLEVRVRSHTRPNLLGGRSQEAERLENLVNFRVAREKRLAGTHLGKDGSYGPHVDTSRVLATTKQDLGGAVPQGDDLVGVGAQGDTEGAGKTEIRQLEVTLAVDQQVLGLEVAVQNTVAVAVSDAGAKLPHELLYHGVSQAQTAQGFAGALRQCLASATVSDGQCLHVLLQIEVEKFEDEVQLMSVGVDDVEQLHDVRVPHLLEEGDFSDGSARHTLVLSLEANLLQGYDPAMVGKVSSLVHDSVGAWRRVREVSDGGGKAVGMILTGQEMSR